MYKYVWVVFQYVYHKDKETVIKVFLSDLIRHKRIWTRRNPTRPHWEIINLGHYYFQSYMTVKWSAGVPGGGPTPKRAAKLTFNSSQSRESYDARS